MQPKSLPPASMLTVQQLEGIEEMIFMGNVFDDDPAESHEVWKLTGPASRKSEFAVALGFYQAIGSIVGAVVYQQLEMAHPTWSVHGFCQGRSWQSLVAANSLQSTLIWVRWG